MSDEQKGFAEPKQRGKANGIGGEEPPPPSTSIFDNLDSLRLDINASLTGTIEHLAHVPVRRPKKTEFFRAHADDDRTLAASVFTDDEDRETYFLAPSVRPLLVDHLRPVLLTTCINTARVLFFWPVPLPQESSGGGRAWGETARQAAALARDSWVRIVADMNLGAYRIHKAEGALADPVWPDRSLSELLQIAFKDRIINDADHPIIRKLRGLA
jgi:hypothetical protein